MPQVAVQKLKLKIKLYNFFSKYLVVITLQPYISRDLES